MIIWFTNSLWGVSPMCIQVIFLFFRIPPAAGKVSSCPTPPRTCAKPLHPPNSFPASAMHLRVNCLKVMVAVCPPLIAAGCGAQATLCISTSTPPWRSSLRDGDCSPLPLSIAIQSPRGHPCSCSLREVTAVTATVPFCTSPTRLGNGERAWGFSPTTPHSYGGRMAREW